MEQREPSRTAGENVNARSRCGIQHRGSSKTQPRRCRVARQLPPPPGHPPQRTENRVWKRFLHTHVPSNILAKS